MSEAEPFALEFLEENLMAKRLKVILLHGLLKPEN